MYNIIIETSKVISRYKEAPEIEKVRYDEYVQKFLFCLCLYLRILVHGISLHFPPELNLKLERMCEVWHSGDQMYKFLDRNSACCREIHLS